ncbi:MAG: efflux RND transporter periplasmic adaptor subunit [Pseudomonadota bacterium]
MSQTPAKSTARASAVALLRRLGTVVLTLLVIAGAAGAVVAGRGLLAERAATAAVPAPTAPTVVAVQTLTLTDGYQVERRFAGQIEPAQTTRLSFEFGGALKTLAADEGDRVAAGDIIATLDTRLLDAEGQALDAQRAALEAQAELARRTNARQETLQQRGFASVQARDNASLGLAELTARIAEVDARRVAITVRQDKAVLRAPFDAVVSKRHVDNGSTLAPAAPVLTLVKAAAPQFRVGLPAEMVAKLEKGAKGTVRFGARAVPVTRAAVLPAVDPATRTRTVLFDVPAGDMPAFGETGDLILTARVAERGAFVPLSALSDGPRGLWRLLTVVDRAQGPTVVPEMANILFVQGERAYVAGTFEDGARVIEDGTHRVVPGERVEPRVIDAPADEAMSLAFAQD